MRLFFVFSMIWRLFPWSDGREFFAPEQGKFFAFAGNSVNVLGRLRFHRLNLQRSEVEGQPVRPSGQAPCHQALIAALLVKKFRPVMIERL